LFSPNNETAASISNKGILVFKSLKKEDILNSAENVTVRNIKFSKRGSFINLEIEFKNFGDNAFNLDREELRNYDNSLGKKFIIIKSNKVIKQYLNNKNDYNKFINNEWKKKNYYNVLYISLLHSYFSNNTENKESKKDKIKIDKIDFGLDAEWQYIPNKKRNYILSTQLFTKIGDTPYSFYIFNENNRYILNDLLELALEILKDRIVMTRFKTIDIYGHFIRVDLASTDIKETVLRNNKKLRLNNIQNTILGSGPIELEVNRVKYKKRIDIYDTWALSNKASLASISKELKQQKLNHDYIENMAYFQFQNLRDSILYSVNDSYITYLYYKEFKNELEKIGISKKVKIKTASGVSEKYVLSELNNDKKLLNEVFGYKIVKSGNISRRVLKPGIEKYERIYHGGYNFQFRVEKNTKDIVTDVDISNCYPLMLLTFFQNDIDWDNEVELSSDELRGIERTRDIDKYVGNANIGYVELWNYKFKNVEPNFLHKLLLDKNAKVPSKRYTGKYFYGNQNQGLYTFLEWDSKNEGTAKISLIEFKTALKNKWLKTFKIKRLTFFKYAETHYISDFIKKAMVERSKYPKGTMKNTLFKLINNSIYGKTCQGISEKSSFDIMKSIETGKKQTSIQKRGMLYNPAIASAITSVASSAIVEIINKFKGNIVNAITDGFMVIGDFIDKDFDGFQAGWVTNNILNASKQYLNTNKWLAVKHKGLGYIGTRNRGTWMLGQVEKERKPDGTIVYWDRLIEQNGISLSYYNCNTEEERIQKLNEFYENRFENDTYIQKRITGLADIIFGADVINEEIEVKFNFDFDLKRKINLKTITQKEDTLSFTTLPYRNIEEARETKKQYIYMRKDKVNKNVLRTVNDIYNLYARVAVAEYKEEGNVKNIDTFIAQKIMKYLHIVKGRNIAEIQRIMPIIEKEKIRSYVRYLTKKIDETKKQINEINEKIANTNTEDNKLYTLKKDLKIANDKLQALTTVKKFDANMIIILAEYIEKINININLLNLVCNFDIFSVAESLLDKYPILRNIVDKQKSDKEAFKIILPIIESNSNSIENNVLYDININNTA
jgi:hypothetical protein